MAFKGIFWIKPNGELLVLKVKCDSFGNLLEDIPHDMLSKSGGNFNHKNAWNALPKIRHRQQEIQLLSPRKSGNPKR